MELTNNTKATIDMLDLCRAVTEISPMPIVGVEDASHRIAYVNPAFCQLVGMNKDQLVGTKFVDIPVVGEQCALTLDRVYRTGKAETLTVRERSGTYPLCSYAMWPVLTPAQPTPGIILQVIEETSIHQDAISMNEALMIGLIRQHELTDAAEALNRQLQAEMVARKKAEEALIRSEKLASVGCMSAVIAHEINNPLAAVTDLLYLAENADDVPETVREYLHTADSELKRIAHITRQTLGFYREMAAPVTFPFASLLESVLDLLRSKINARRAALDVQCDKNLEITAVHGELRQVFSNLIVNSLDALGDEGKVTMRASRSRDPRNGAVRVRVTVSDNGKGIDQTALSQIFEPFFTTKGSTGNGLGLWVTKQIIEKHGGQIRVRSQISGQHCGTSFSILLPICGV
jgi:two-component system NtrC family sensor kinase